MAPPPACLPKCVYTYLPLCLHGHVKSVFRLRLSLAISFLCEVALWLVTVNHCQRVIWTVPLLFQVRTAHCQVICHCLPRHEHGFVQMERENTEEWMYIFSRTLFFGCPKMLWLHNSLQEMLLSHASALCGRCGHCHCHSFWSTPPDPYCQVRILKPRHPCDLAASTLTKRTCLALMCVVYCWCGGGGPPPWLVLNPSHFDWIVNWIGNFD